MIGIQPSDCPANEGAVAEKNTGGGGGDGGHFLMKCVTLTHIGSLFRAISREYLKKTVPHNMDQTNLVECFENEVRGIPKNLKRKSKTEKAVNAFIFSFPF